MTNIEAIEKIKTLLFGSSQPEAVEVKADEHQPAEAAPEPQAEESAEPSVDEKIAQMQSEIAALKEMIVAVQQQVSGAKEESQAMAQTFRTALSETLSLVQTIAEQPTAEPAQKPKESFFRTSEKVTIPFYQFIKK
jgi:hypothetical protein